MREIWKETREEEKEEAAVLVDVGAGWVVMRLRQRLEMPSKEPSERRAQGGHVQESLLSPLFWLQLCPVSEPASILLALRPSNQRRALSEAFREVASEEQLCSIR